MKTTSFNWGGSPPEPDQASQAANLVFYFGQRQRLAEPGFFPGLRRHFPKAILMGCSTGGQISAEGVGDEELCGLSMSFETSRARLYRHPVNGSEVSHAAGVAIGQALLEPELAGIIVFSDGLNINGSELAEGLASVLPKGIPVAGGMAGDGDRFELTLVGADAPPAAGCVAAVGLYGPDLEIQTGYGGGWTVFGPKRKITGSNRNVLSTLDGAPALDLYDTYLGPEANALPGSGLRFPLLIRDPANPATELIRTLLAVDRDAGTMTFAGNLPLGWTAQLMRANFVRLADGAGKAARAVHDGTSQDNRAGLLVSCIGRRLVLGQRTDDEIEAVRESLGMATPVAGFYSYGEFSPGGEYMSGAGYGSVELHNQTMTVVTIAESGI